MVSQDVAAAKAAVLIESLPWLRRYHGGAGLPSSLGPIITGPPSVRP